MDIIIVIVIMWLDKGGDLSENDSKSFLINFNSISKFSNIKFIMDIGNPEYIIDNK